MLYLNIQRILAERGITQPTPFLKKAGFAPSTISKLFHDPAFKVNYSQLEKLCIAFRCTPNDLICWNPDKDTELPDNHPLHKLRHTTQATISHQLHQLSIEEIEKVKEFMKQMKEEVNNEQCTMNNGQ